MSAKKDSNAKQYYFFDINLQTKQIIGWGVETRDQVEVNLSDGYHRIFVSRGQYNKLVAKLS